MQSHDVVVIGAGMAGLSCAVELHRRDLDVVVLEASDAVGGRIRTDHVDGMLLDRGFQLLNPAYPALAGLVDLPGLGLQSFEPGVTVASDGRRSVLADPFRSPRDATAIFGTASGSVLEKGAFAAYALRCAVLPPRRLKRRPDVGYGVAFDRARIRGTLRRSVLEPFLAGVLAEDTEASSRRFVDLLLRMFARGVPALPRGGMQALPQQVADLLPEGSVRLDTPVGSIEGTVARGTDDQWQGRAVVVAAHGPGTARLTSLPAPTMRGLTTFYHRVSASPASRAMLHVDGDRGGPVVNTAVVSDVARSYSDRGSLVESTVLGDRDDAETRSLVERQLSAIYGTPTTDWELIRTYAIPAALPAMLPPLDMRQAVALGDGRFVCGDHRDTASIQGAIVSGRRAAAAVVRAHFG